MADSRNMEGEWVWYLSQIWEVTFKLPINMKKRREKRYLKNNLILIY